MGSLLVGLVVASSVLSSCSTPNTDERGAALASLNDAEQRIDDLSTQLDNYRERAETAEARAATAEEAIADLELEPAGVPQKYDLVSGRDTIETPFLMAGPDRETLTVTVTLPSDAEIDHVIRVPGGRTIASIHLAAGEQPCAPNNDTLVCTINLPAIPENPGLWWLVLTKTSDRPASIAFVLATETVSE